MAPWLRAKHILQSKEAELGEYITWGAAFVSTLAYNIRMISLFQSGMSGGRRGWTIFLTIVLSSCLTGFLQAQAPPPEPPQAPAQRAPKQLAPEELNRLLAPIALYPDALIALILPA